MFHYLYDFVGYLFKLSGHDGKAVEAFFESVSCCCSASDGSKVAMFDRVQWQNCLSVRILQV